MGKGKEEIIPRIPKIRPEQATPEIAAVYEDYAKTVHQPGPCISFQLFAHFPALLKTKWDGIKLHVWEPGTMSKRIKEGISIVAAKILGCEA